MRRLLQQTCVHNSHFISLPILSPFSLQFSLILSLCLWILSCCVFYFGGGFFSFCLPNPHQFDPPSFSNSSNFILLSCFRYCYRSSRVNAPSPRSIVCLLGVYVFVFQSLFPFTFLHSFCLAWIQSFGSHLTLSSFYIVGKTGHSLAQFKLQNHSHQFVVVTKSETFIVFCTWARRKFTKI